MKKQRKVERKKLGRWEDEKVGSFDFGFWIEKIFGILED
jgi:hypothetical protein